MKIFQIQKISLNSLPKNSIAKPNESYLLETAATF